MDLLEMIQASNTPVISSIDPNADQDDGEQQYKAYVKGSNNRKSGDGTPKPPSDSEEYSPSFTGIVPGIVSSSSNSGNPSNSTVWSDYRDIAGSDPVNNKDDRVVVPTDSLNDNTRANPDWEGYRDTAEAPVTPENSEGYKEHFVPTITMDQETKAAPEKYSENQNEIWSNYASNVKESALALAGNFKKKDRKNDPHLYRKRVHINTNVKMVGFVPNPEMMGEAQGSGVGEMVKAASKVATRALSEVAGLGGAAEKAMSWVNWTCPSYAYVLPPGIDWVWNKSGMIRDMIPMATPSDASISSSMGTAVNSAISFAENFNLGYNKALIAKIEGSYVQNSLMNKITPTNENKDFERKRVYLVNDVENGKRGSKEGTKQGQMPTQVYHYGLRKQGSDLTGAVLRQKRQDAGLDDTDISLDYDAYTFYEFSYPLKSSVSSDYFQGVFTNLDFSGGKTPSVDFLIHAPARLTKLPKFAYKGPKGEPKDISRICDLDTTDTISLLGWMDGGRQSETGINQGRFGIFNTYMKVASQPTVFNMTAHETDNYDVYKWMAQYYRYYYYMENRELSQPSVAYNLTFTNDLVHRSPYECFYYLEIMYMRDFEPEYRHVIYMVVPQFNFNIATERDRTYQTYRIAWQVIGQVKTDSYSADDKEQANSASKETINLSPGKIQEKGPGEASTNPEDFRDQAGIAESNSDPVKGAEKAQTESSPIKIDDLSAMSI